MEEQAQTHHYDDSNFQKIIHLVLEVGFVLTTPVENAAAWTAQPF